MNIEEIKVRLSNLEHGKVIKYDHAMNLATQYMLDYKNDVTFLLSFIESLDQDLSIISNSENVSAMNSIAEDALKAIRGN